MAVVVVEVGGGSGERGWEEERFKGREGSCIGGLEASPPPGVVLSFR
jgi:hypothetical protein